jgi:SNF2 family DNA or RNA helicase
MFGPHLVVMPLSVINSWRGDIARFVDPDRFDLYVHHGEKGVREDEYFRWLGRARTHLAERKSVFLALTSYEMAMNDLHLFQKLRKGPCQWEYLVVILCHAMPCRVMPCHASDRSR